jgi:hypothetical protein
VRGVAVRDELGAVVTETLDGVVVTEAGAAQIDAPRPDAEPVVEARGQVVVDVHVGRERLDPLRLDGEIAAGMLRQVRDTRDLEPDDERCVVRDRLRVRLGEADRDLGREVEAFDERTIDDQADLRLEGNAGEVLSRTLEAAGRGELRG